MDNTTENILKLFKSGATIKGLIDMTYSEMKSQESGKKASDRKKVDKKEIKSMVERIIYEDCLKNKTQAN